MDRPLLNRVASLLAGLATIALIACDDGDTKEVVAPAQARPAPPSLDHSRVGDEDHRNLRELEARQLRRLQTSDAELFPACRELFERDGEVAPWPFGPGEHRRAVFGCDPEAYLEFGERRAIAYAHSIEGEERASNLQVAVFDADGALAWTHLLDRSSEARNFSANYRGSFLTTPGDRVLCGGTLFQGGVRTFCAQQATGEVVFDGELNFWAGVKPFGIRNSLVSTDLRGITLRYPFSGAEMRHRALPGRGGRAAFYATDGRQIYFAPAEDDPMLSAWDAEELRMQWEALLPARPRITFQETSLTHHLLFVKVGTQLLGLDTRDGSLRMAFEIGDVFPPVAFGDDAIYLLLRRGDDPALLYALEPDDGAVRWVAFAPTGTLDIAYDQGLLVRSVRAVRQTWPEGDRADE